MNFYNLNFNPSEVSSEEDAWRLSHKENGTTFSSLVCRINGRPLFVSSTRNLQEALDEKGLSGVGNDLDLVPLYNKTLVDVVKPNNQRKSLMVYLKAEPGKTISTIKFDGCGTVAQRVSEDRTIAAFAVITVQNDFRIRMFQSDGKLITINKQGDVTNSVIEHELVAPPRLRFKKIMVLPRNAYFNRFTLVKNEDGTSENISKCSVAEGFQVVNIAQAVSNKYIVINKPEKVEFDSSLTEKDIADINNMLNNVGRPVRRVHIRKRTN